MAGLSWPEVGFFQVRGRNQRRRLLSFPKCLWCTGGSHSGKTHSTSPVHASSRKPPPPGMSPLQPPGVCAQLCWLCLRPWALSSHSLSQGQPGPVPWSHKPLSGCTVLRELEPRPRCTGSSRPPWSCWALAGCLGHAPRAPEPQSPPLQNGDAVHSRQGELLPGRGGVWP